MAYRRSNQAVCCNIGWRSPCGKAPARPPLRRSPAEIDQLIRPSETSSHRLRDATMKSRRVEPRISRISRIRPGGKRKSTMRPACRGFSAPSHSSDSLDSWLPSPGTIRLALGPFGIPGRIGSGQKESPKQSHQIGETRLSVDLYAPMAIRGKSRCWLVEDVVAVSHSTRLVRGRFGVLDRIRGGSERSSNQSHRIEGSSLCDEAYEA
jgi:hypothetical protein